MNYNIMNSRQIKELLAVINTQFSSSLSADQVFLANKEGKIYIITRDFEKLLGNKNIRINSLGLYIGQLSNAEFRPSIEGAQIIFKTAKKNIVKIDDKKAKQFLMGKDIEQETECKGYVILANNNEAIGTARAKEGILKNYNPKTRRILVE